MPSNTLDELGRAVLEAVADGRTTVEGIERRIDASDDELEARLEQLTDNALAREVDGEYELTENGHRLLGATPIGVRDDRIDTPERVEAAIEGLSLPPDEADAVRNAFSFLRYWGEATTAEIVDAAYSEDPAGYETAGQWWDECVADRLAGLPDVRFDPDGGPAGGATAESPAGAWTYEGEAAVESPDEMDGRSVDDDAARASFGSARHAIEALSTSADERAAARAAFAVLFERGRASAADLADRVYDDHPAGYGSTEAWGNWLTDVFDAISDVERAAVDGRTDADERAPEGGRAPEDDRTGPTWTYDPSLAAGSA